MTTAALSAPSLQIPTVPDIMDLHSDGGLDLGDGDIDLDLHSTGGLDDDVSVSDAATDAGMDVQTVPGDQDDFMADNEDLIEEDAVDDDVEINLDQHSIEHSAPGSAEVAHVEEDLIDYSDDEDTTLDEAPAVADTILDEAPTIAKTPQRNSPEDLVTTETVEEHLVINDLPETSNLTGGDGSASQHTLGLSGDRSDQDAVQGPGSNAGREIDEEAALEYQIQNQSDVRAVSETATKNDSIDEHGTNQRQVDVSAHSETEIISTGDNDHALRDVGFHPITVNYDGAELWLFKHHDYDDSGDFLVEDDSLANKPVSTVLDACRDALGADISSDLELGFRLDCFHNIELYQEHSSCAFVTLDHIVRLYLQLHEQDGTTDPQSFYMTLLLRPRVSSLLNELNNAAAKGIGHAGLNNAIVSGQTAFTAHNSHNSTEQFQDEWEESDQSGEQEVQSNDDTGDRREHGDGDQQDNESEAVDNQCDLAYDEEQYPEEQEEQVLEGATDNSEENTAAELPTETADDKHTPVNAGSGAGEHVEQTRRNSATVNQPNQVPEEDFIDYSDDEDHQETRSSQAQTKRASSASSTIQGDETSQAQGNVESLAQDGRNDAEDNEQAGDVATWNGEEGPGDETFAEYEGHDPSYEGFDDQAYGATFEGDYGQEYNEGQEDEGYPAYEDGQAHDKNTNYPGDFGDYSTNYADDLSVAAGFNVGEPDGVDEDFEGTEDFLDFNNTATAAQHLEGDLVQGAAGDDEINYEDEDSEASQAPVAVSAAADTVATSSSALPHLSPQGQKRTIDEVGNDVVNATTSSDAKRPRV